MLVSLAMTGTDVPTTSGSPVYCPPTGMNDHEIVLGCKRGDPQAVRQLAERHYDRVYRVALAWTRNGHTAEDLTQETFTAAIRGIRGFREASSLFTWLVGILRRQWLYRSRREKRLKVMPDVDPGAAPDEDRDRKDAHALMRSVIEGMGEDDRVILVLFYVEELRYTEIAASLEIPIGTVKSRLNAARTRLKDLIEGRHAV
jgi:RNA polymerase sigma-70 factor (ECF subfamily)